MKESKFQGDLIKRLRQDYPGCIVLKNDANYLQGFCDLLVLHKDRWAALEVKAAPDAAVQPNQEYYVKLLGGMSFAAFIDPENIEEVLHSLYYHFL